MTAGLRWNGRPGAVFLGESWSGAGFASHAAAFYFGNIFLLTAVTVVGASRPHGGLRRSLFVPCLLGLLLLLPANELAVLAVNYLVTPLLPPRVLPKMSFRKGGIPDDCRTLVVVPMLLTTPDAIRNELGRLEIRYLANSDPNLHFALLSDFADAPLQNMPEDAEYFEIVARGIAELNRTTRRRPLFSFSSPAFLERERTALAWLGTQARQARTTQSLSDGRIGAGAGGFPLRRRA